jgi:uncharacterized SAM-binding protein YcdF (DUF218 family)
MRLNRARARRILSDLGTGAVLGGLIFVAARALGLPVILGWNGYEPFLLVAIVAALLFVTVLRALVWGVAGVLIIVVAIAALTPAFVRPARAMIRADAAQEPFDAVAILSSGLNDDQLIAPDGLDRTLSGLALARSQTTDAHPQGVPVVLTVVTRGRAPLLTSAGDQQRIVELAGGGIDVHWTSPIHSTRDEARAVAALARSEGWNRVAVVTSPIHTRRACATFERAGLTVRCVPAEAREFAVNTLRSSRDRVRVTQLWFYEVAGTAYYKLRGWM